MNQYEPYYAVQGTAADTYATITFSKLSKGVDISIFNYAILASASYTTDTSEFEEDFELGVGVHQLPLCCRLFRLRNKTPGQNALYSVTGYVMISDYA